MLWSGSATQFTASHASMMQWQWQRCRRAIKVFTVAAVTTVLFHIIHLHTCGVLCMCWPYLAFTQSCADRGHVLLRVAPGVAEAAVGDA